MPQQLGHFFLNIDNDVGFLQFFLETLIVLAQLFILGGQRIPLHLRTPLLRKGFVHRAIALFAPAVQSRRVNPLPPQNGADTCTIGQSAISLF